MTASPPTRPGNRRFRGDIDGLRAVAIVLVVAYHAGLSGISGGFIGVDVFFVISGYLITTNLLTETHRSGEVDLLGFWAKRIRRLVPALALMLVVVLGLALIVLSSLEWRAVADEGRAAALYVSNIYFAEQATDYFAADVGDSLFLHTWSLGVEEQFYLVWPLLFGATCLVVRRRPALLRRVLIVGFAVTFVASFALCLVLTERGSAWAFFSLPTRAWEFAAAGLLAAVPAARLARGRTVSVVAGLIGLVLIGTGALAFSSASPYPGARALLPVLGTLLVIGAGMRAPSEAEGREGDPVSAALAAGPAQWVGRVSYSWYLWHWPLILLAVAWLDDDRLVVTVGAALVSLGVAVVAQRLVENPLRFAPGLVRSNPRTYAVGAVATLVAVAATVGVVRYADAEIGTSESAATLDEVRKARRNFDCPRQRTSDRGIDYCEAGDPDSGQTVLLMGDSHTRHWAPAFIEAAEREGDRLVIRWRGACPSTNVPIAAPDMVPGGDPVDEACTAYQRDTDELIDELDPDVVVLSNSATYVVLDGRDFPSADAQAAIWEEGLRDRIESLQADGRAVALVNDTPRLPEDPIPCLAEATEPSECAVPRGEAFHPRGLKLLRAEQRVVDELGTVAHLDVNDLLCPDELCVMQIDGRYVYSDKEHLYDGFAATLAPEVIAFIEEARTLAPRRGLIAMQVATPHDVRVFDPLLPAADADAMVDLCERFGTYTLYTTEQSAERFAPELAQRYDAAYNFVRTGGRFGRGEPPAALAARTNYFREEYAYGEEVRFGGIEPLLHHAGFVQAAQALHGRAIIEPSIVYANILVVGQELAVHTDVPEFRGANRRVFPQWLMVVMHHSGLFDEWRMPIATGIAYFGESTGGELAYYPDGADGKPRTHPTRHNTAVLLDTDTVFHGVDRVGGPDAPAPPLCPGYTMRFEGDDTWTARDLDDEVVATYPWRDVRLSVSWKAYCFADEAEREVWQGHVDDLSLELILDRLVADLRRRGRLSGDPPSDENDLGRLLIDEYITFPPPEPVDVTLSE